MATAVAAAVNDEYSPRCSVTRRTARALTSGAYLAGAVLLGLVANSLVGAWWLDPLVALTVAAVAVREGRGAWRGEQCC